MADLFANPAGLNGFEFIEFSAPAKGLLESAFTTMGFRVRDARKAYDHLLQQGAEPVHRVTGPMELNLPAVHSRAGGAMLPD